jgi:hypothetical protein
MNKKEITDMINKDRKEWALLTAKLDAHPEGNLHGPLSIPWNARDVYAHLSRWLEFSNCSMKAYCAGQELPVLEGEPEAMNSRWQQEDSTLSLKQARIKAHKMFAQRLDLIQSIPMERWDEKLQKMAEYDGSTHLAAHRSYIV